MDLTRKGNVLVNNDKNAYIRAKKRSEHIKEEERKFKILDEMPLKISELDKRLSALEEKLKALGAEDDTN